MGRGPNLLQSKGLETRLRIGIKSFSRSIFPSALATPGVCLLLRAPSGGQQVTEKGQTNERNPTASQ